MDIQKFEPLARAQFEAELEKLKEDVVANPDHYEGLDENDWHESLMSFQMGG